MSFSDLIEAYEAAHHPIPDLFGPGNACGIYSQNEASPGPRPREEMGMAHSTVSHILSGKRGIGRKHIDAFVRYFHVSSAVFLPEP